MKNIASCAFYSLLIVSYQSQIIGMTNNADQNGISGILKTTVAVNVLSIATSTSTVAASSSALTSVSTSVLATAQASVVAVKGAAIAVVASPAFIPVVAGVAGCACGCGACYLMHKGYRYFVSPPSQHIAQTEQNKAATHKVQLEVIPLDKAAALLVAEKELIQVLLNNTTSPRDAAGIPIVCQKEVCKFAMMAEKEHLERILHTFSVWQGWHRSLYSTPILQIPSFKDLIHFGFF